MTKHESGTAHFLNLAGRIPLLTHTEEVMLGHRVQARRALLQANPKGPYTKAETKTLRTGSRARERMVTANLRLVVSVAKKYAFSTSNLSLDDLIQEGMIGLITGVERFDPEKGYRCSTYFFWWIRQSISRAKAHHERTIRLPVNAVEGLARLRRFTPLFDLKNGRPPTLEECATELGVTVETTRAYLAHTSNCTSLDTQASRSIDDSMMTLVEMIPGNCSNILEDLEKASEADLVEQLMVGLTDMEYATIKGLYGLHETEPKTFAETSKALKLSRRKLENTQSIALKKMRAAHECIPLTVGS